MKPSSTSPLKLIEQQQQAELRRQTRLIFSVAVPCVLLVMVLDTLAEGPTAYFHELPMLLGCTASLAWILSPCTCRWSWAPGYGGLWLTSLLAVTHTGGLASPYFFTSLAALATSSELAISLTSRLPRIWTLLNLSPWLALAIASAEGHENVLWLIHAHNGLLLLAVLLCARAFRYATSALSTEVQQAVDEIAETRIRLAHSAKLAELGTLFASTIHELGQPLQTIATSTALLKRQSGPSDLASKIEESSNRAIRLLRQIRSYSRKEAPKRESVDLADVIRSVYWLSHADLRARGIRYTIDVPSAPLKALADFSRLQQVLFNLVSNARDACLKSKDPAIRITASAEGNWVRIRVSNTGPEIPAAIRCRLFEHYFTTKTGTAGLGLGLAISEELVKEHGGRLLFSSEPEHTVFLVDLPAQRATRSLPLAVAGARPDNALPA